MGTMAGWAMRKANEATARAKRDNAMKIIGAREEAARVRVELLEVINRLHAGHLPCEQDIAHARLVLRAALDRIIPEER